MDGIVFRTDGTTQEVTWSPPTLKQLQDLVGGLIERVTVDYEGKDRDAFVNEEGKIDGLPLNQNGTMLYNFVVTPDGPVRRFPNTAGDSIHGDMVVVLNPLPES